MNRKRLIKQIGLGMFLLLLLWLLSSCSPAKLTSKSDHSEHAVQIRTEIQTQIDSIMIYRHDSVYIREKSDTVFVEKWHTKIAYRDRLRSDTLRVIDTVRISDVVEKTVEVEVNRITGWQWTQIYAGRALLIIILVLAIYTFFKYYKKL